MRKYSSFLLLILMPVFVACDAGLAPSPGEDTLRTESASESKMAGDHLGVEVEKQLTALQRATVRFHDPAAAEAAGYHPEEECITASTLGAPAELGAMGVHYVNESLIDGTFEVTKPEALVYEERGDGSHHLVAVEYLFTGEEAPAFAGTKHFHPFPLPFADFALHAWVWQGNPAGVFADFNVNVTCPAE